MRLVAATSALPRCTAPPCGTSIAAAPTSAAALGDAGAIAAMPRLVAEIRRIGERIHAGKRQLMAPSAELLAVSP